MAYSSVFTKEASDYVMSKFPLGKRLGMRELNHVKSGLAARGEYYTIDQIRSHVRSRRRAKDQSMRYKRPVSEESAFDPQAHWEARHYRGSFDL